MSVVDNLFIVLQGCLKMAMLWSPAIVIGAIVIYIFERR